MRRLRMVPNSPGTPIARNRKPKRTASAVSTPRDIGDSSGEITAARHSTPQPNGIKNQPDRPKSVIFSKALRNQTGSWFAHVLAAVSKANIEITTTMSVTTDAAPAGGGGRGA